ncbi:TPA: hypothetical protein N0F65_007170 [Lagenidium giganteum]|uniref:EGF-like domain-containing protein n=1 Tax=Lagenidium giganteum TaxID=4803 RepID=A0AAV2Z4Q4_9STRA|nr:TPA: hypothetical protein N0F65_007170 [Lagenidium giganteum]
MNTRSWVWLAALAVGMVMEQTQASSEVAEFIELMSASSGSGAASKLNAATKSSMKKLSYACEKDADCSDFPDTVCILINNYGETVGKCTPNTKSRPACRGGQPGLCPSYQDAQVGYLNAHCIFVAVDDPTTLGSGSGDAAAPVAGSGSKAAKPVTKKPTPAAGSKASAKTSGSGSAAAATKKPAAGSGSGTKAPATTSAAPTKKPARMLGAQAGTAKPNATKKAAASGSGSTGSGSSSAAAAGSKSIAGSAKNHGTYATVVIGNDTVTGYFKCVDVSDCQNQAYDSTTCEPKECGASSADKNQCNNHGTCTYPSIQTMTKRRCMCYKGFQGDKCQQEISAECDVDCGAGGDCVDGECKCKKGYDGKSYKGKAGKPSQRCTRCTNDQACQNNNPCNVETGKCDCASGYFGPTCGATEDGCTKISCGNKGSCKPLANGTGACFCSKCRGSECQQCEDFKCMECANGASQVGVAISVMVMSAFVAAVFGSIAL